MVAAVSPDFLKVFDVQPMIGRDFLGRDAKKGAAPTVLVSYGYWKQYLGAPRDLSQSHLKIADAVFSVIGVLPAGFRFPTDADLWIPADLEGENSSRTSHNYYAVGRLRDGVTVEQANRDVSAIALRTHYRFVYSPTACPSKAIQFIFEDVVGRALVECIRPQHRLPECQ